MEVNQKDIWVQDYLALVHQETQFIGNSLGDLEPMKTFHCWRDMFIFPNIEESCPRGSYNSQCWITQGLGLGLLVVQI